MAGLVPWSSAAQIFQQSGSEWVSFREPGRIYKVAGFEIWQTLDSEHYEREVYLRKTGEESSRLIYSHHREISLTVGHQGRTVLINDYAATKTCKVVTVELATGKESEVGSAAVKQYVRSANPDSRLVVVPEAQGFSPDDRQVLIKMKLVYVSFQNAEQAATIRATFKPRWYAVESYSGHVLREYRTGQFPEGWWRFKAK
ncbi:MAG TPA: hypothetical protein VJX29_02630 [Candidatus Acidoferrales bacterium]|nr:hypothetical protein [Candidatus Acidoferrales bacterium]